jgi:hypothetical protein
LIELKRCPQCGIPEYISSEHQWLDNGDIVLRREPWYRMVFIECQNLDPLWRGIEEIIGVSIEHIVITAQRRAVRLYLSQFITKETSELIHMKRIDLRPLAEATSDIARLMGFGDYEYMEMRYEMDDDDFYRVRLTDPYSLPMCIAALVADIEALSGRDQGATCEEVSPGVYHVTSFPSEHLEELKDRMWLEYYHHERGDVRLERCAACEAPLALSEYRWRLERGVIENESTKRRMVIQGYQNLDPIFQELESELGESISKVVVEAQRRFTKTGFYSIDELSNYDEISAQLALRGLGNLKEINANHKGLHMHLGNAVLPLIIVGLVQGFYEIANGLESNVEWQYSGEGDLEVEVTAR